MKTVILGAGFTGMAAGIRTGATIYEASNHSGGICTDYIKDGFRFSNGGPHFIFGKDAGLDYIKTLVEVKEYQRNAGVYYNHTFPYPFQSEMQKTPGILGNSFKNDLFNKFGTEQCNMFFFPFNEKYTAGLYDQIISQDEYKTPKSGTGWVSTFCDPAGGLSTVVDKMSAQCHVEYNKKAISIDTHNKLVRFDDLYVVKYDRLISTIPLNQLVHLCGAGVDLPYSSVLLVINIGAEPGINLPKEHWLYIPFCKNRRFHRVAFYTNVDTSKAPQGKVGLSVEKLLLEGILLLTQQECIKELQSWGWIGDIITCHTDIVECAYTWQYNREDVPSALAWLKERDIISTGRYGSWKFCGLTQSIMDGFSV